jgi:hypothetical protein
MEPARPPKNAAAKTPAGSKTSTVSANRANVALRVGALKKCQAGGLRSTFAELGG